MIEIDWIHGAMLVLVGLVAGAIESTAGGSGMITLPTLLALGLNPVSALATSKLQYLFGAFSAIREFRAAGLLRIREQWRFMAVAFIASSMGAWAVLYSEARFLQKFVPWMLLGLAAFFSFSPRLSDEPSAPRISSPFFLWGPVVIISLYDGFFGLGSASFFILAFVLLRGYSARQATAETKLIDGCSGLAAFLVLLSSGEIHWTVGACLGAGQMMGAKWGARGVLRWGSRLIRPLISLVSAALALKIILQS
jgi:hypothetical protein